MSVFPIFKAGSYALLASWDVTAKKPNFAHEEILKWGKSVLRVD